MSRLPATARALLVMALVEAGLRTAPLPRLCRWLRVRLVLTGPVGAPRAAPLPRWARVPYLAADGVARRWPAGDTCLRRCLLLAVVLRPLRPVLRVGWRADPAPAVAHAWLEVDGESLDRDTAGVLPLHGAEGARCR